MKIGIDVSQHQLEWPELRRRVMWADDELAGDGRLPGEQREGACLDLALLAVDLVVVADDLLGEVDVGLEQGRRGAPHR